jgi:hypothetical protein
VNAEPRDMTVGNGGRDPLAGPRLAARRWMIAGACSLPLLVWAAWLPGLREPVSSAGGPTPESAGSASPLRPPIRVAVFDAPLWTLDPPPDVPPAPPAPLRLQLVGLVRDGGASGKAGTLKAVIYNQETDELLVVAEGARVGVRDVTRIDAAGVTLSDGRRLLMEGGQP